MAIRHWSGRRLVGTWAAGAVAECLVIAAPIVFLLAVGANQGPSEQELIGREWQQASTDIRRADVEAKAHRAEAQLTELQSQLSAPVPPTPPVALNQRAVGLARAEAIEAHWYTLPLAGAVVLYLFAIPVGLLGITAVWLISRLDRPSQPPPSTA